MEMHRTYTAGDSPETEIPQQGSKNGVDLVESTEAGVPSTYADIVASRISTAHRDFLMERHGTLELDPIPSMDPADPYNWPSWKVRFPLAKTNRRGLTDVYSG
jgi:hypothetical protein